MYLMKRASVRFFIVLLVGFQSFNSFSNPKLKEFNFPDIGFSIRFPHETKKIEESSNLIRYHFQQFDDRGKNIGTAKFSVYPNFVNDDIENVINQIKDEIKEYKVGNSVEVKSTEKTVRKGFYQFITIHSEYFFNNETFTIKREDYLFKSCKGMVHIHFMVPSYNCYLTEYDRAVIVKNSFSWLEKDINYSSLDIKYTLPRGVFQIYNNSDNNSFTLKPCIADYKTEIEVVKHSYVNSDFSKAAENYFAEQKKNPLHQNMVPHVPTELKRENKSFAYVVKFQGQEYNILEFLIRSEGVYYTVKVVSTCSDIDGCGGPLFIPEMEKFVESIQTVVEKKEEEDDYDLFGW